MDSLSWVFTIVTRIFNSVQVIMGHSMSSRGSQVCIFTHRWKGDGMRFKSIPNLMLAPTEKDSTPLRNSERIFPRDVTRGCSGLGQSFCDGSCYCPYANTECCCDVKGLTECVFEFAFDQLNTFSVKSWPLHALRLENWPCVLI